MTGPERALLYLTSATTGWRWGELRKLRRLDFRLDASPPHLAPPASTQKAGREDTVSLRADVAAKLARYFASHPATPDAPTFPMPASDKGATMLAVDREAAGVPRLDGTGRVADFHSFRHSLATWLAEAKVSPKVAQATMRHASYKTTEGIYTHLDRLSTVQDALESLPALIPAPDEPNALQATETALPPTGGGKMAEDGREDRTGEVSHCHEVSRIGRDTVSGIYNNKLVEVSHCHNNFSLLSILLSSLETPPTTPSEFTGSHTASLTGFNGPQRTLTSLEALPDTESGDTLKAQQNRPVSEETDPLESGAASRVRTGDLRFTKPLLYP